jgi:hypothetical protein
MKKVVLSEKLYREKPPPKKVIYFLMILNLNSIRYHPKSFKERASEPLKDSPPFIGKFSPG